MPLPEDPLSMLRRALDFESLTAELLTRFVEIPAGEIDGAVEAAQLRVCELFDLDVLSLWQWAPGSQRYLTLTHDCRPGGGPSLPERTDAEEMFPWSRLQVLAKRPIVYSSIDSYPPEAVRDRESFGYFGIQSLMVLPLSTGGGPVLGAIAFATTRAPRRWDGDVVTRLQLVSRVFAGALGRRRTDEALRLSEERLNLAAESAGVGLWELDLATSSFWVTDQARRHLGLSAGDPVTISSVLAAVVPEDRPRVMETIRSASESGAEEMVDYRLLPSGGEERWLSSRGQVRRHPTGEPVSILGVTVDVTGRKKAEGALRDLSQRLIRAHEEERALLARDLHDDLTQRLAVLAIDVGRAELAAPGGPNAEVLRGIREGLVSLSEDVHSLAYQLHPTVLEELGLAEALRTECERFRRQGRAELSVDLDPERGSIGAEAELCLFRVAQEALRNVERHSGANAVRLSLRRKDGGLLLKVRDDGVGFDPDLKRTGSSLGLLSMRERVRLAGGTLRVDSVPGEGTAIVAWVGPAGAPA